MNSSIKILLSLSLIAGSIIIRSNLFAQNFTKTCSAELPDIDKSVVDHSGNIYLTSKTGDIRKINAKCEEELIFSPEKTGKIKQLDIWSPFKVFAFYEELQEYVVLNRFLSSPVRYNFSSLDIGYVSNATLNFQQNLWLIDESDFTLKLIDIERNNILTSQQLSQFLDLSNHQIIVLKENKGRLFLVDETAGILIFDSFGNYLDLILAKNVKSIQFENESLIYYSSDGLYRVSLKTLEIENLKIPKANYLYLLQFKNTFYCITNNRLDLYQYLRKD